MPIILLFSCLTTSKYKLGFTQLDYCRCMNFYKDIAYFRPIFFVTTKIFLNLCSVEVEREARKLFLELKNLIRYELF